jgi:hypothetical protein
MLDCWRFALRISSISVIPGASVAHVQARFAGKSGSNARRQFKSGT